MTSLWIDLLRRPRFWTVTALLALVALGLALGSPQVLAWYHLRAARFALQSYHTPEAIRHLQACLHTWTRDGDALLLAARAARRARVYADADRCLEKYQQVRGCDDACALELILLSAERSVDQVADVCRRYVEQGHAETPLILEALARGYMRQYRLPEARFCLHRWLEIQPDNVQAVCLEGQLHLDYERAVSTAMDTYRRAVRLDPDHQEARQGLAVALLEACKFSEALEHLEFLRKCQPDNLRVQVSLAQCREGLGDLAEAARLTDGVLARQPDYAPALSLRGRLALAEGQVEAAETWLRQAVARDAGDHAARFQLILCLHRNGKEAEAKQQQQDLQQRENDLKRFNEIVTRDMAQRPNDPALHVALGQLLLRGGHTEEGLRWLHNAVRLDPDYAPARQALTEYYQNAAGKKQSGDRQAPTEGLVVPP